MPDLMDLLARRPHRADAARNFDAIVAAARVAFAAEGADVALDEIARSAGVGIATLYRRFPNRESLVEAAYVAEVEEVCRMAERAETKDPDERLRAWLARFVDYIGAKRALVVGLNQESATYDACRQALYAAGEPLLVAAQQEGVARIDVTIDDVMRLASGIAAAGFRSGDQRTHVLSIALDGLNAPTTPSRLTHNVGTA